MTNGSDHLDKQRSASDAERMTVLSALGFSIDRASLGLSCPSAAIASGDERHRARYGLKCDRSEAFQKRQNDLREFVIRHWDGSL